jgi:uncharacterized protein YndB with AHSA1/START domain
MPSVSTNVYVSRPPAEVFDFLADARNLPLWSSGVAHVDPAPSTATATRGGTVRTAWSAPRSSRAAA